MSMNLENIDTSCQYVDGIDISRGDCRSADALQAAPTSVSAGRRSSYNPAGFQPQRREFKSEKTMGRGTMVRRLSGRGSNEQRSAWGPMP
jgi:hypothetical protein